MTRVLAYVAEAAAALWRNRTRSILTMLGMIIGTSSIIAVFGISKGATSGIAATFASFGTSPVFIQVDQTQNFPQYAQFRYSDAKRVQDELGTLAKSVQPFYFENWHVRRGNRQHVEAIVSVGGYNDSTVPMQEGRRIDDADVESAARVCVLTSDVAQKFFGTSGAVGKELIVNGSAYLVIGVYPKLNGSFFNAIAGSSSVLIPYSTFHRVYPGPPAELDVYPADPSAADRIGDLAKLALRHIHGPRAQYTVMNGAAMVTGFENVLGIIGTGLSAIGGVALLVAGIGIMNIMLVSVAERTREIGIRKSIGASRADIALQFLLEALLLALAGGGIGMALGLGVTIGAAQLISKQLGAVIIPYLLIVSIALSFSIAVGMLFGTYPAIRAARMDPVEALRS